MILTFLEILGFLLSSVFTLVLVYYKIPIVTLQQIILGVLIILLLSYRFLLSQQPNQAIKMLARFTLLLLSSSFVQILVISSGGLYSPLLILLHFYTLGASFLLEVRAAIIFLVFSLAILVTNIILDPKLYVVFKEDPGSAVLYFVSFIVVIPLAQTLMKTYHLKDKLSKLLGESLNLRVLREKSILTSLNEIVVITDQNLKIIAANDAFESATGLSGSEFINKNFLDRVALIDKYNAPANINSLSIKSVLSDNNSRIISGFYFTGKNSPRQVAVEVEPITGPDRRVRQLVFVIKDPKTDYQKKLHSDLELAHTRQNMLIQNLKKNLEKINMVGIGAEIELIKEGAADLLIAQELEDHPIKQENDFEDVVLLCKRVVLYKQDLARSLGVNLELLLSDSGAGESSYINLREENSNLAAQVISPFMVGVNSKWFDVLIKKLLDLAILLASAQKDRTVKLSLGLVFNTGIDISITALSSILSQEELKELFVQYYGNLANKTNLRLGSGLEGFIAKSIIDQLSISFSSKIETNPNKLTFILKLNKHPDNSSLT